MVGPIIRSRVADAGPFTPAEQAQIVHRIDAARTYLIDAGVSEEALAEAHEKLDYLVEAAKRSGRMVWVNIAFSVLFGIATQLAFAPDRARELIQIVLTFMERLQLQYGPRRQGGRATHDATHLACRITPRPLAGRRVGRRRRRGTGKVAVARPQAWRTPQMHLRPPQGFP